MTRESKLALVIGITMVLLVGVLVSDHLSGATGARFDAPAGDGTPVVAPAPALPDAIASLPRAEPISFGGSEPAADTILGEGPYAVESPAPIEIAQGRPTFGIIDNAIDRLRSSDPPALMGSGLFERVEDRAVTVPPAERRIDAPIKPIGEPERAAPASTPAHNPVVKTTTAPATAWKTHRVAEGDSLYAIARTYLGNGERWTEIQKLNEDVLHGSADLSVGMVLKIARARAIEPGTPGTPGAGQREYVVLQGDVLGSIAQKLLGSSKRAGEIVALNGLKDPDDIRVGQTLKIPAR